MAHAACSREEPQPKFLPATSTLPAYVGSFITKSALGRLSLSKRQSRNKFSPKPSRVVAFRKRAGMIWSVSIFSMGIGTTLDVNVLNFFIVLNYDFFDFFDGRDPHLAFYSKDSVLRLGKRYVAFLPLMIFSAFENAFQLP